MKTFEKQFCQDAYYTPLIKRSTHKIANILIDQLQVAGNGNLPFKRLVGYKSHSCAAQPVSSSVSTHTCNCMYCDFLSLCYSLLIFGCLVVFWPIANRPVTCVRVRALQFISMYISLIKQLELQTYKIIYFSVTMWYYKT